MTTGTSTGIRRRDLAALLGTLAGASLLEACAKQPAAPSGILGKLGAELSTLQTEAVEAYDDLRAVDFNTYSFVLVRRYSAGVADYGAAGLFYWDAESTLADNDGTVLQPASNPSTGRWVRVHEEGRFDIRWFGASTALGDNQPNIQAAIDAAASVAEGQGGAIAYVPPGRYDLQAGLVLKANVTLSGYGRVSILRAQAAFNLILVRDAYGTSVRDLDIDLTRPRPGARVRVAQADTGAR